MNSLPLKMELAWPYKRKKIYDWIQRKIDDYILMRIVMGGVCECVFFSLHFAESKHNNLNEICKFIYLFYTMNAHSSGDDMVLLSIHMCLCHKFCVSSSSIFMYRCCCYLCLVVAVVFLSSHSINFFTEAKMALFKIMGQIYIVYACWLRL